MVIITYLVMVLVRDFEVVLVSRAVSIDFGRGIISSVMQGAVVDFTSWERLLVLLRVVSQTFRIGAQVHQKDGVKVDFTMLIDKVFCVVSGALYRVTGISSVSIVVDYLQPNVLSTLKVGAHGKQGLPTTVEGEGMTGGSSLVG